MLHAHGEFALPFTVSPEGAAEVLDAAAGAGWKPVRMRTVGLSPASR